MTDTAPRLTLGHATLAVRDLDRMVAFYTDVLGFHVTNRGEPARAWARWRSSPRTPTAHHQIVLVQTADTGTATGSSWPIIWPSARHRSPNCAG
jgi:catechol 2,3-dioxygenase-like lactoylglutathione lyase family enzyme